MSDDESGGASVAVREMRARAEVGVDCVIARGGPARGRMAMVTREKWTGGMSM